MNSAITSVTSRVSNRVVAKRLQFSENRFATWGDLIDAVAKCDPAAIGVDLFDTVLMRRLVDDASVERAIAARHISLGLWSDTIESWLQARKTAVAAAPNGSIDQVYSSAPFAEALSNATVAELVAAEVAVERELISAVPGAVEAMEGLRAIAPVQFVSDMHLPAAALADILDELGVKADGLFVSSDLGASKFEGDLFDRVFGSVLASSDRPVVFIGNSVESDGVKAHEAGLQPLLVGRANPSRYETAAMSATAGADVSSAIAAASRFARLKALEHDHDPVAAIGAQTVGQIMSAFLLWLRESSEADGVTDLRFLARDGELPLLMAEAMPADHWSGIGLHYLHCSRRTWALAAAGTVGVKTWLEAGTSRDGAFLIHSADKIPFSVVVERLGLGWSDLPSDLRLVGADEPLGAAALQDWKAALRNGDLDTAVAEASALKRRPLVEHLRSAGFSDAKVGLVDVGWTGQLAWMVQSLIAEAIGQTPVHYHFGGEGVTDAVDQHLTVRRFAFDDSVAETQIAEVVTAMEIFLGNGKPRLLGYEDTDEGVVEVFETSGSGVMTAARQSLADGAIRTAAELPSRAELNSWAVESGDLAESARLVLAAFWLRPSRSEMEQLRALQFEIDLSGDLVGPIMSPYTMRELVGLESVERQWRTGSLQLTPPATKALFNVALRARDLLSKVR